MLMGSVYGEQPYADHLVMNKFPGGCPYSKLLKYGPNKTGRCCMGLREHLEGQVSIACPYKPYSQLGPQKSPLLIYLLSPPPNPPSKVLGIQRPRSFYGLRPGVQGIWVWSLRFRALTESGNQCNFL